MCRDFQIFFVELKFTIKAVADGFSAAATVIFFIAVLC